MKIKLNKHLGTFRKGSIVNVDCDAHGIPLDQFWRRRLADAKIDNCCEIVKPVRKPAKSKEAK